MASHIVPPKVYVLVFAALMVLTLTTYEVALVDVGVLNSIVALLIAFTKASLVVLFFMHGKYSHYLTRLVVGASLLWLVILLGLTMSDYLTRGWIPQPGGW